MKLKVLSLTSLIAIGFAACNSNGSNTGTTDSTTTTNTATTTNSSNTNYSAMADTIERNSQAGYYLNPRTGKPLHVKMDRSTGRITDADANTPVNRFVDKRTWWVYGGNNWDTVGTAKMQGNDLMYEDQSGQWVNYDKRWKDENMNSNNTGNGTNASDSGMNNSGSSASGTNGDATDNTSNGGSTGSSKMSGNPKVKVSDHGNKVKIKTKE